METVNTEENTLKSANYLAPELIELGSLESAVLAVSGSIKADGEATFTS
jgi:hypothetical protein